MVDITYEISPEAVESLVEEDEVVLDAGEGNSRLYPKTIRLQVETEEDSQFMFEAGDGNVP